MTGRPRTALRRISWIRIVEDDRGVRAEAVGLGHRMPAMQPVSMATAVDLVGSGVPVVFRRHGAREETA